MSYYREVYLKSEHWQNLRVAKLCRSKMVCAGCGLRATGHDVHHLRYGNLRDVTLDDLRVVCRRCHELAHVILEEFPKIKALAQKEQWRATRFHIHKRIGKRNAMAGPSKKDIKRAAREEQRKARLNPLADKMLRQARQAIGVRFGIKVRRSETPNTPAFREWLFQHFHTSDLAMVCMAGRLINPAFKLSECEINDPKLRDAA